MEKDLIQFEKNIKESNYNNCVEYEDEKGNYQIIPISSCIVGVQYNELTKEEYQKALFQGIIKDKKYDEIESTRVVDKSTITHNKKDQGVLIDKKVIIKKIYVVTNGLKATASFENKDDAIKLAKEINNKYRKLIKE